MFLSLAFLYPLLLLLADWIPGSRARVTWNNVRRSAVRHVSCCVIRDSRKYICRSPISGHQHRIRSGVNVIIDAMVCGGSCVYICVYIYIYIYIYISAVMAKTRTGQSNTRWRSNLFYRLVDCWHWPSIPYVIMTPSKFKFYITLTSSK